MQRNLKAQLKFADKIGAKFTIVLGEDEVKNCSAKMKNMTTGEQTDIKLDDNFLQNFFTIYLDAENKNFLKM